MPPLLRPGTALHNRKTICRTVQHQSQHPNFANAISFGYCPVDALVLRRLRHLPLHLRLWVFVIGGSRGTTLGNAINRIRFILMKGRGRRPQCHETNVISTALVFAWTLLIFHG